MQLTLYARTARLPGRQLPDGLPAELAIGSHSSELRQELEAFYASLDEELRYFGSTLDAVWQGDLLIVARCEGRMTAMAGLRSGILGLTIDYLLVHRHAQHQGLAQQLRAIRAAAAARYRLIISTVLSDNPGKASASEMKTMLVYQTRTVLVYATSFRNPQLVRAYAPLLWLAACFYFTLEALQRRWPGRST